MGCGPQKQLNREVTERDIEQVNYSDVQNAGSMSHRQHTWVPNQQRPQQDPIYQPPQSYYQNAGQQPIYNYPPQAGPQGNYNPHGYVPPPPNPIIPQQSPRLSDYFARNSQGASFGPMAGTQSIRLSRGSSVNENDVKHAKIHLNQDTIELMHLYGSAYQLQFKFDATVAWNIDVHFAATEITNDMNEFLYFYTDLERSQPPISVEVEAGMKQDFQSDSVVIDTGLMAQEVCLHQYDALYPITIHIRNTEDIKPTIQSEATFVHFTLKDETYIAQVDRQKIYMKSQAYELDQVYDMGNNDEEQEGKECCICMCEVPTILLMPCRHLWIWADCESTLKGTREQLWPICRVKIDEYINVGQN